MIRETSGAVAHEDALEGNLPRRQWRECPAAPDKAPDSNDLLDAVFYWDASDVLSDLRGNYSDWFRAHNEGTHADVQNNYHDHGRQRKRTRFERNGMRFDVHLWARIDWHREAQREVATELRRMAEFLNEKADEIEKYAAGTRDERVREALAQTDGEPAVTGGAA
jgi:ABC-type Zn2+ transport system substrate-binding protein/surface adhesin